MRLRVDGETVVGPALDVRDRAVAPRTVLAAIRDAADPQVACRAPGRVHELVGHVHPGMECSLQRALAAAARSRGQTTTHRDPLDAIDEELAASSPATVDLADARRRVADASADVADRREQVARASGRVEARRDAELDDAAATRRLREATRRLSEAETERIAAEQALASERRRAREARDERERRLRLVDRRRNLERRARAELAAREADRFERAIAALPVDAPPAPPEEFAGPDAVAALAVVRLAAPRAPVVIEEGPFRHAAQARACLHGPVVLI